jgi:hypothetical protein
MPGPWPTDRVSALPGWGDLGDRHDFSAAVLGTVDDLQVERVSRQGWQNLSQIFPRDGDRGITRI